MEILPPTLAQEPLTIILTNDQKLVGITNLPLWFLTISKKPFHYTYVYYMGYIKIWLRMYLKYFRSSVDKIPSIAVVLLSWLQNKETLLALIARERLSLISASLALPSKSSEKRFNHAKIIWNIKKSINNYMCYVNVSRTWHLWNVMNFLCGPV